MSELQHHGVVGMKWGVRRYQNKDGTLTDAGKKRHERDVRENLAKKKENRIDTSTPDPKRYAREDLERSKSTVDATSDLIKELKKVEQSHVSKTPRMDLSKMSDKDMRERINRELLERQYNQLFASVDDSSVNKGRERVREILDASGTVLTLASSALGIAVALKKLKD